MLQRMRIIECWIVVMLSIGSQLFLSACGDPVEDFPEASLPPQPTGPGETSSPEVTGSPDPSGTPDGSPTGSPDPGTASPGTESPGTASPTAGPTSSPGLTPTSPPGTETPPGSPINTPTGTPSGTVDPSATPAGTGTPGNTPTSTPARIDADQDGYGVDEDCNDQDSSVNPSAHELCNQQDDNCNGSVDEGYDQDNDGVSLCDSPADCNDQNPTIYPGAPELCNSVDEDCDPATTASSDVDGDGFTACSGDCDDNNASTYPSAQEQCDHLDNNCNGQIDEGLTQQTWHPDADSDGYGNPALSRTDCQSLPGEVLNAADCDDALAGVNPAATEICNGIDDDCDTQKDEGLASQWYLDEDGDGFGVSAMAQSACLAPEGYAAKAGDCNDRSADIYPGAPEQCNSLDDDCDGAVDDNVQVKTWYLDEDEDGYGLTTEAVSNCARPAGYAAQAGDCDDTRSDAYPGATEYCNGLDDNCDKAIDEGLNSLWYEDLDQDGYGSSTSLEACERPGGYADNALDCDDRNPLVNPAQSEICDGLDQDCDGLTDEGVTTAFFKDADLDGYGISSVSVKACSRPDGYASQIGDCNDANPEIHPNAPEQCDGLDQDCDGTIDEDVLKTFYQDKDKDGYGNPAVTQSACTAPSGYVSNNTDCNDNSAASAPGLTEVCDSLDNDCNGQVDENSGLTYYPDSDNDGYGSTTGGKQSCSQPSGYVTDHTDCNDAQASINPKAAETCNGVDDDCDALIDDADPGVTGRKTYYADGDKDGFGTSAGTTQSCSSTAPTGYSAVSTDCNDADASIHPNATEVCDSKDNDCDLLSDDADPSVTGQQTWYVDLDGDEFGNSATAKKGCTMPPGYVAAGGDCNDTVATIYPGAPEQCNSLDDDCDGQIDEQVQVITWYQDVDADGYGNPSQSKSDCKKPVGYVLDNTDCADTDPLINPAATEICDAKDQDCDGLIDEDAGTVWYGDADKDNYGTATTTLKSCSKPSGYSDKNTDCNDNNASIYPGAPETCNGADDDCDNLIDDGVKSTFYADSDGDGYGNSASSTQACSAPTGYVSSATDCNDSSGSIHPNATETCDGVDQDCDGQIDEGLSQTWYQDKDGDGFGDSTKTSTACAKPTGYVAAGGDCNDGNASIYPGATEKCNNLDDDCDNSIDEGLDADGDGYTTCSVPTPDCNDANPAVYPGATEACDSVDANCDGDVDTAWKTSIGIGISVKAGASSTGANGTVSKPYPTIQQGINDTRTGCWNVAVDSGTYKENIDFKGKNANVVSVKGVGSAIIDGQKKDSVVKFITNEGTTAALRQFRVTNGAAVYGGGIRIENASPVLDSNVIDANAAQSFGGGLYLLLSNAKFTSNDIFSNIAKNSASTEGRGGGLYIEGGAPYFENNTIRSNSGYYHGGGVALTSGARPSFVGGTLSQNTAGGYPYSYGGGLYSVNAYPTLQGLTIDSNTAGAGGGGIYISGCASVVSHCELEALTFTKNKVSAGNGGAVFVTNGGELTITRSIVDGNTASSIGGGFYIYYSDVELSNNLIHCNNGGSAGGGIYMDTSYAVLLNNTILENLASTEGGGIYFFDSVATSLGAIITNNVVYNNNKHGVFHGGSSSKYVYTYNNSFGNKQGNYSNMTDPSGTLGNISSNPSFTTYQSDCKLSTDNLTPTVGSPLVDSGTDSGVLVDINGRSRPRDGNGDGTSIYDMGSYER